MIPSALRRPRILILAIVVIAVAAGVFLLTGGDDEQPVGEAGSRFGESSDRAGGGTLLDTLAPVLGATQTKRGGGSDPEPPSADELGRAPQDAVAGLFVVGFRGKGPGSEFFERLAARPYGGVLLTRSNYDQPQQLATLTRTVQSTARGAGNPAPLVAAQQEGGEFSAFRNLAPKPQVDVGEEGPRATFASALSGGKQLKALGVTLTLAPNANIAVAGGPGQGRGFSDRPSVVTSAVRSSVGAYKAAGIISAVGPFPGDGAAAQDPNTGPGPVGLGIDQLRGADMKPFEAVASGRSATPAMQMSNAIYVAYDAVTPATLLPDAYEELRDRLGFTGAIVSADLTATTATSGGNVGDAAVEALKAGADLLLIPGGRAQQDEAYRAVVSAVRSRDVPAARVVSALRRIATLRRLSRGAREPATLPE
ncbi:MAG: glycoside hydrolase family 3 N-terminal domain-containing protein [Solirubrobacteraceae bacterium]